MKLLFLCNEVTSNCEPVLPEIFKRAGFEVDFYWVSHDQFPPTLEGYDAVFLSGSVANPGDPYPWIAKLEDLLREIARLGLPTLGVCFGSQVLAYALCGHDQVFRRESCELTYADLTLNHSEPDDPLIRGLGPKFRIFSWHNMQVKSGHPDMRILGYTEECSNHIWRYKDLPIWGIQGHAELSKEDVIHLFHEESEAFEKDGFVIEELVKMAEPNLEGHKLYDNFIAYCKNH